MKQILERRKEPRTILIRYEYVAGLVIAAMLAYFTNKEANASRLAVLEQRASTIEATLHRRCDP